MGEHWGGFQSGGRAAAEWGLGRRLAATYRSDGGSMTELRAGFARRDITQPIGSPASLGLRVAITEIWDPLYASACVLESDGERVAIVGLDLCGLLAASHLAIRDAVSHAS